MVNWIAIGLMIFFVLGLYLIIRMAQKQAEQMENQDYEKNMKKKLKKIKTY